MLKSVTYVWKTMHACIKDLIPTPPQKEKGKKNEKEKPPVKLAEKAERAPSKCPHHFGYLADHPKSAPIPEECLTCQKMLECINKSSLT